MIVTVFLDPFGSEVSDAILVIDCDSIEYLLEESATLTMQFRRAEMPQQILIFFLFCSRPVCNAREVVGKDGQTRLFSSQPQVDNERANVLVWVTTHNDRPHTVRGDIVHWCDNEKVRCYVQGSYRWNSCNE